MLRFQAGIIYAMIETSTGFRVRRSPIQAVFRNLWVLLAGEVLLLGVAFQNERSLVSGLTGPDGVPENAQELIHMSRAIGTGTLVAIALFVAVMAGLTTWAVIREQRRTLVVETKGIFLPEALDHTIPFENIGTLVFSADPVTNDAVLIEGVTADADNAPHTTLEMIGITNAVLSPGPVDKSALPLPSELGSITRFHHFRNSEDIAAAIAAAASSAKPDIQILTLVNKYRKQRVIWRKAAQ